MNRNQQVDVCFIGAGIAGITTAYFLVRAGKMVAVLDNGQSVAVKRVVRVGDAAPRTLRLNPAADAGLVAERAYCEVYEEAKVTTQLRH